MTIEKALDEATRWMDQFDGVTGVGEGRTDSGEAAVMVFVADSAAAAQLPREIEGIKVLFTVSGPIDAQPGNNSEDFGRQ